MSTPIFFVSYASTTMARSWYGVGRKIRVGRTITVCGAHVISDPQDGYV